MMKKILLAGIFTAALNSAAFAAGPTNVQECNALVKDTFTMLAKKNLSEADAKKAEGMLDTLVGQCEKKSFSEADKTAMALKAMAG